MGTTAILVEGESDKAALLAAAEVLGVDLSGVSTLVMGGASNVVRFLTEALNRGVRVGGLYDVGEEGHLVRALGQSGLTKGRDRDRLEDAGFFRCDPDLEAELIAALGSQRVLEVIGHQGEDARRFRSLQQMPEWRDQAVEAQLRRWFGSGSGRKIRYASLLVAAMTPEEVPRPLAKVLDFAAGSEKA